MNSHRSSPFSVALLALSLVAASAIPAEPPPVFLAKWGSYGTGAGEFDSPAGAAVDSTGNVYVVDKMNHRIQKFDSSGSFLMEWGAYGTGEDQFNLPNGVAVDTLSNVYVGDVANHRVQKYDSNGNFLLMWGWGVQDNAFSTFQICTSGCQKGISGSGDGQFYFAWDTAVDAAGNVYVVDRVNNRIQKFDSNGTILGKWGAYGSGDSQFDLPLGVAVDAASNVYVADGQNHRIQKFAGPWLEYFVGESEPASGH